MGFSPTPGGVASKPGEVISGVNLLKLSKVTGRNGIISHGGVLSVDRAKGSVSFDSFQKAYIFVSYDHVCRSRVQLEIPYPHT